MVARDMEATIKSRARAHARVHMVHTPSINTRRRLLVSSQKEGGRGENPLLFLFSDFFLKILMGAKKFEGRNVTPPSPITCNWYT